MVEITDGLLLVLISKPVASFELAHKQYFAIAADGSLESMRQYDERWKSATVAK